MEGAIMYKQAAGLPSAISSIGRWIDNGAIALGNVLNPLARKADAAEMAADRVVNYAKTRQTKAYQQLATELAAKHKAEAMKARKAADRVSRFIGYGTATPVAGLGLTAPFVGSADDAAEAEGELEYDKYLDSLSADIEKVRSNKIRKARAAHNAAARNREDSNDESGLMTDLGLYAGSATVGATAGALLDSSNRLRGGILGGILTPSAVALAKYLYDNRERQDA